MSRLLVLMILLFAASPLHAEPTGTGLFRDASLGTNGKSCASCHDGGKGLQEIEAYDDRMLQEMVNFCIRDAMKGTLLPEDDPRLVLIRDYTRSLDTTE